MAKTSIDGRECKKIIVNSLDNSKLFDTDDYPDDEVQLVHNLNSISILRYGLDDKGNKMLKQEMTVYNVKDLLSTTITY